MIEEQFIEPSQPLEKTESQQPVSLKKRIFRGTLWTLSGHILSQGLRFGSNLILTRLLYPEAFGLMALVYTFISGLEMFSDTGVNASIVQNRRGDDPTFLNTGWTVQVIRGTFLWIFACVLAQPAAVFYQEPMLAQLLPIVGLQPFIAGFYSTKMTVASRQLALGRLTLLDLSTQIVGLITITIGAWIYQSVWALVVGALVAAVLELTLSHTLFEGTNNRFKWDKTALKELQRFGRWVFVSTILTFLAFQSDRLVVPRLAGVSFLGIYAVALTFSRVMSDVLNMLGSRVLFPSYAELVRERPERLYPVLRKARLFMLMINWAAAFFFILFGQQLIGLLYDNRYLDAGWMLQLLAIGLLVESIGNSYGNVLLARGNTFEMTVLQGLQVGLKLGGMGIGYAMGGEYGLIFGIAMSNWLLYPAQAICYQRLSLWQPEVDFPFLTVALGVMVLFFVF
ncbi:MAG: oligosaccharide flippase family protein [Oscillatoriales cyanobacterium C42_A2020_001]|nr:oligosaccharide flippase family protein [Leptolyngbyaceae cyanobacterium C42_A2020_001]